MDKLTETYRAYDLALMAYDDAVRAYQIALGEWTAADKRAGKIALDEAQAVLFAEQARPTIRSMTDAEQGISG